MKNKLITQARNSSLMDIRIVYGKEEITFNLFEEVVVDENKINQEIKNQPSVYAYLNMLYKKLIRVAKSREKEMEKRYANLFVKYKNTLDPLTNRPYNNDIAEERVKKNTIYQKLEREFLDAEHNASILEVCVKAFEQRYSLIQTLSANIRKSKEHG